MNSSQQAYKIYNNLNLQTNCWEISLYWCEKVHTKIFTTFIFLSLHTEVLVSVNCLILNPLSFTFLNRITLGPKGLPGAQGLFLQRFC